MPSEATNVGGSRLIPEAVAIVVMATVLLFVHRQFAALVEPVLLNAWLAFMACCIVARAVTVGVTLLPAWRHSWPGRSRGPAGKYISFAFCLGIVASVWILMPPADPALRLLMILLCMWFIAMVIVLNADRLAVVGSLAVVASMAAFTLVYDLPYALPLAGFLVMEGAALVMIRRVTARSARALQEALAIVQAERDAKTRFIASASHDLQQPLQAARLYFDQILASDEATKARAIEGARSAFSSTQTLLESMLDHLRLEADAVGTRPVPLWVGDVMTVVALEHEPSARAAGLRIRTVPGDVRAVADERLVRRILGNLLANAVKHSRGGRLLLAARQRADSAELWVVDDGRGVDRAEFDRLFEDYYQGASRDAQRVGGFGIGLASARRMAMLMGGSLELDPRWKRGCAFVLRLPLATPRQRSDNAR